MSSRLPDTWTQTMQKTIFWRKRGHFTTSSCPLAEFVPVWLKRGSHSCGVCGALMGEQQVTRETSFCCSSAPLSLRNEMHRLSLFFSKHTTNLLLHTGTQFRDSEFWYLCPAVTAERVRAWLICVTIQSFSPVRFLLILCFVLQKFLSPI